MTTALIVVNRPCDWPIELPDVTVVPARKYLVDPDTDQPPPVRTLNLCRSYRYQSRGYYVSPASARGQHPLPDVRTIEDLASPRRLQPVADALGEAQLRSLASPRATAIGSISSSAVKPRAASTHSPVVSSSRCRCL